MKTVKGELESSAVHKEKEQLAMTVRLYAKITGFTEAEVLKLLDMASGDFQTLDEYFRTRSHRFLWSPLED